MQSQVPVLVFARLKGCGQLADPPGNAEREGAKGNTQNHDDRDDGWPDGFADGLAVPAKGSERVVILILDKMARPFARHACIFLKTEIGEIQLRVELAEQVGVNIMG